MFFFFELTVVSRNGNILFDARKWDWISWTHHTTRWSFAFRNASGKTCNLHRSTHRCKYRYKDLHTPHRNIKRKKLKKQYAPETSRFGIFDANPWRYSNGTESWCRSVSDERKSRNMHVQKLIGWWAITFTSDQTTVIVRESMMITWMQYAIERFQPISWHMAIVTFFIHS